MTQDFRAQFLEQREFIRSSSAAYDTGYEAEAKRLATSLRVLLHDTRHSTSLLTHLGLKERMPFCDTASPEDPPGVAVAIGCGLCMLNLKLDNPASVSYSPVLDKLSDDRRHPPTCFEDWWNAPVLEDTEGNTFSRRSFILDVANKDGGAHIDAALGSAYGALTRGNSLGFGQTPGTDGYSVALTMNFEGLRRVAPDEGEVDPPSNSIALASIRQIAHEISESFASGIVDDGSRLLLRQEICPIPFADKPDASRNDLCPCGSGKKFKRCFGQRRPRLVASLP